MLIYEASDWRARLLCRIHTPPSVIRGLEECTAAVGNIFNHLCENKSSGRGEKKSCWFTSEGVDVYGNSWGGFTFVVSLLTKLFLWKCLKSDFFFYLLLMDVTGLWCAAAYLRLGAGDLERHPSALSPRWGGVIRSDLIMQLGPHFWDKSKLDCKHKTKKQKVHFHPPPTCCWRQVDKVKLHVFLQE